MTILIPYLSSSFAISDCIVTAYPEKLMCAISCLHVHSATASVQELRPSALRSELAYRALRVSDSSPLASSGSLSKNFCPWQRGHAATWEQRTFAPFGMCPD